MVDELASTVLVVGAPATGKTHFGAQLLGRLRAGRGGLKLRSTPDSIEPLRQALDRLNGGLPADHTSVQSYAEVVLPLVERSGATVDLVWPDYGGEKIQHFVRDRRTGPVWQKRIQDSDAWILFLRPSLLLPNADVFSKPIHQVVAGGGGERPGSLTPPAWYVELLQLLLFVRGCGAGEPARSPRLAVLLSCWDELPEAESALGPLKVLEGRAALFSEFLQSRWDPSAISWFGLSSTGRALREGTPDDDFQERGPEAFGYVIDPEGESSVDLTIPLQWLLASDP
jgi:double-GTPase-like protein